MVCELPVERRAIFLEKATKLKLWKPIKIISISSLLQSNILLRNKTFPKKKMSVKSKTGLEA